MQAKNWISATVLILLAHAASGQSDWKLVEETSIKGSINGVIRKGYIFKVGLRDFYVINEWTRQRVLTRNPRVKIFESKDDYRLEIEDFDEPVICRKMCDVVETQIDGVFTGWEGETIWKMQNGQTWQQASYAYLYESAFSPEVMIYRYGGEWIMKVEGVDETIEVKKY